MSAKAVPFPVTLSHVPAGGPALAARKTAGRRFLGAAGDLLLLLALIFCIPMVILAIGIPIALLLQLLVSIGASLR